MVIPTKPRERLSARGEGRVIITIDPDHCLRLYAPVDWEPFQSYILSLPPLDEYSKHMRRTYVGHATDLEIDGHGRLALPGELREYAGLTRNAMLVGQVEYFELWDEGTWAKRRAMPTPPNPSAPRGPGAPGAVPYA